MSLINTLPGMRIDLTRRRPLLANRTGGMSGPGMFPLAVRMVYQVRQATKLPILGMGGVAKGSDAAELMMAGADAVAVGTACFADVFAPLRVRDGLRDYLEQEGLSARALTNTVQPW